MPDHDAPPDRVPPRGADRPPGTAREGVVAAAIGGEIPEGTRFIGPAPGAVPGWPRDDAPTVEDLNRCVACGLCLPHCPTYRLTGEESASPRGRIAAIRAVSEGRAEVDATFARFMDLCLACRACEDVCPSHVPFARMMEHARVQIEPLRPGRERLLRRLGLELVLPRRRLLAALTVLAPLARPFLPRHARRLVPRVRLGELFGRLPPLTEPQGAAKGTVALLAGCVQDRWFREVNRATIRVLARNGWRVAVPAGQTCCGALQAHHGRLRAARRLAARNLRAFEGADHVVVNAAGCGAHLKEYGTLLAGSPDEPSGGRLGARTRDLMEFLHDEGVDPPHEGPGFDRVAYHDACHALRAQGIRAQPRSVLGLVPGLELVEVEPGDVCCGAAGLYNVLEPATAGELGRAKAAAVLASGAPVVASANPGCSMQLAAHLRELDGDVEVLHPVEILDRAYRRDGGPGL